MSLEHKVEFAYVSPGMFSASRTVDFSVDKGFHFLVTHRINRLFRIFIVRSAVILDKLVCPETRLTFHTVNHRIRKMTDVTGSFPSGVVHKNSAVKTYYVIVQLRHFFPPRILNISLEVNA